MTLPRSALFVTSICVASRTSTCLRCTAPILLVSLGPDELAELEPDEVLPLGPCGECDGKGTIGFHPPVSATYRREGGYEPGDLAGRTLVRTEITTCPACQGSGQQGEQRSEAHIIFNALHGTARTTGRRCNWDALHRRHQCVPTRSESLVTQSSRGYISGGGSRRPTASES